MEYDNRGKIREGLATTWEWDADTLTWTFHLRDENWVDCSGEVLGPVTAQDFVDALQYVLTPAYASSTASLVTPYVAGAEDYYNYLFYKASAANGTVAEDGTTYAIDANGTVTAAAADGKGAPRLSRRRFCFFGGRQLFDRILDKGIPCAALRAFSEPFGAFAAAGRADVYRFYTFHRLAPFLFLTSLYTIFTGQSIGGVPFGSR